MAKNYNDQFQWFIAIAIGGKENKIVGDIKEKISLFNYANWIKEVKIFNGVNTKVEYFDKDDDKLPKNLNNTETVTWESSGNRYKKITRRVVNKFPGYIFVNAIMDDKVWGLIRNTPGVLGFVGSLGKGVKPMPISISEFERIENRGKTNEKIEEVIEVKKDKVAYTTNLRAGMTAEIIGGGFNGETGLIKKINLEQGNAIVDIEMFGSKQSHKIALEDLKQYNS